MITNIVKQLSRDIEYTTGVHLLIKLQFLYEALTFTTF